MQSTLTNTHGTNHGAWAFAMKAVTGEGAVLRPVASGEQVRDQPDGPAAR